jgi:methylated-DNA-protein-cysteine methyltransferase related protein
MPRQSLQAPLHDTPVRSVGSYARIYDIVRRIPRGRVATYGQVASLAGLEGHARQVGYALHALPASTTVPWHRVINARGEVSVRAERGSELTQRFLLQREGVRFDARGRVALARFGWRPSSAAAARRRG